MGIDVVVKLNKFPTAASSASAGIASGFASLKSTLLSEMQGRTPVETGALLGSETATSDDHSLTLTAGQGLPDARALYVHQGTYKMAARPFMRDTVEGNTATVIDVLGKAIEAALQ